MSRQPDRGTGVMALGLIPCLLQLATPAASAEFPLAADGKAIGAIAFYDTLPSDTLMDVARSYDLGFTQLMAVNPGTSPWMPPAGTRITLPNVYLLPDVPHQGIVIDLAAQRLYYFPPGQSTVESYPIGIGVVGAATPVGTSRVTAKVANPVWYPPPSIHAERPELPASIPAGPDNPLGAYALRLGWPKYLIHGTNKPDGVGRNVSHSCIHLYPEDMERLFREVAVGTEVRVVNDDVKLAWIGNDLFVEAHPTKEQSDELDIEYRLTPTAPPADLEMRVAAVAGDQIRRVDRSVVRRVVTERTGVPTRVTSPGGSGPRS
jgi:L,D-transpeptidase ErfK/SrfK